MREILDRRNVLQRLAELDRQDRQRRVFGASSHQYRMNPPLPVSVIEVFEERHGVTLPADYRLFMTQSPRPIVWPTLLRTSDYRPASNLGVSQRSTRPVKPGTNSALM